MVSILSLQSDEMDCVVGQLTRTLWHGSATLRCMARTCVAWAELAKRMLAKPEAQRVLYVESLRRVRLWQKLSLSVFEFLCCDVAFGACKDEIWKGPTRKDLNATDVPGSVAHFACALFEHAMRSAETRSQFEFGATQFFAPARFQIRDEEAMDTFLTAVEHDMLRVMKQALVIVGLRQSHQTIHDLDYDDLPTVSAHDLFQAVVCLDSPQPTSTFLGGVNWDQTGAFPASYVNVLIWCNKTSVVLN